MNFKKLENNLLDMIQEQQVKIGYMSGSSNASVVVIQRITRCTVSRGAPAIAACAARIFRSCL